MSTKKMGCLRNFVAVAFTTIVTPVLANVIAQDVKGWQEALEQALEGKHEVATEWNRPMVEGAAPQPRVVPYGNAPVATPPARKGGEWHWAAGAWGQ